MRIRTFGRLAAVALVVAALGVGLRVRQAGRGQQLPACCGVAAVLADTGERPAYIYGWPRNFGPDGTPVPLHDPTSQATWPNRTSHANSDDWISRNHDRITSMHPRMLVINFSNEVAREKPLLLARQIIDALRESSRYHGYADPKAPAFLDYSVWRYVDLRDAGATRGNSVRTPHKPNVPAPEMNMDYGGFFSQEFAAAIGVRDPADRSRFLRLDELIDQGFVHEVLFVAAPAGDVRSLECIEMKPVYDEQNRKVPGRWAQCGNGGDPDQRWTGRSLRINGLNETRGIGCGMENLGHSLEGMAHGHAIPRYSREFYEFAGFDLDKRWGLPFNSFYPLWGKGKGISYPDPSTAVVTDGEKTWTIHNYFSVGGNVHFIPNGRSHYDMAGTGAVMSTIEDWRIGSGPGGKDLAKPWTTAVLKQFEKVAPDCMGKWLVYWRQNMPGYRNRSKDDAGRPIRNWWPYLFY